MIFFYLTNVALDVSFGVLWWVTKNTTKGIYNGVNYLITDNSDLKSTDYDIDNDYDNNQDQDNDKDLEQVNFLDNITILDDKGDIELKDDEFLIRGEIISLKKEIQKLKNYQKKIELV